MGTTEMRSTKTTYIARRDAEMWKVSQVATIACRDGANFCACFFGSILRRATPTDGVCSAVDPVGGAGRLVGYATIRGHASPHHQAMPPNVRKHAWGVSLSNLVVNV